MSEGESRQVEADSSEHTEPVPLTKRQQQAAGAIGGVLAVSGVVAVFTGGNQAGSVAMLVVGALFLLVAVSGMPVVGARIRDFELRLAERRVRALTRAAGRLPDAEANRLKGIIDAVHGDPFTGDDALLALIESLLFEARVRDGVVADALAGERVEPHPEAEVGEPLVVLESPDRAVRIGVFALYARSVPREFPAELVDEFMGRLAGTDCHAVILVTAMRDNGGFGALAAGIRAAGLPVSVEDWRPVGEPRPLRSAIERLTSEVLAHRAALPPQTSAS
ncbi:hypothetical protein ACFY1L_13295 [Streptomyces sp. NPDC001663]|uniref:hypothetical protein n=1 Tax=Streptomyces sp. NPDC001663 TaxID=3364597 RepID=UPI003681BA8F